MASFGIIRTSKILGEVGSVWYVQLWKKDYTGSASEALLHGEGFTVKWNGQGGTRDRQFMESECVLNVLVNSSADEDLMNDIYVSGDKNYYVRIYKNGFAKANVWWFGWVNPSFSKIENISYPYESSIKATDSIGTFSKQKEAQLTTAEYNYTYKINNHIVDFGNASSIFDYKTDLITNGDFLSNTNSWNLASSWSLHSGGGSIDFNGAFGRIYQPGVSIAQGDDVTISFTLENIAVGGSIGLLFTNELNNSLVVSQYIYYTENGVYVIKGSALQSATGIKIYPASAGSTTFSITNISIVAGLESNPNPSPTNNKWFYTAVDWWRDGDAYQSDDPFYLYRIAKSPYRRDVEQFPENYLKYDVLKGALKIFNTVGFLSNGRYNFIQPSVYQDNLTGNIRFYQYKEGVNRDTTAEVENHILHIDGTTNANKGSLNRGSTFTFEPPLEDVSASYLGGNPTIDIPSNVEASNYINVGNLQEDPLNTEGYLKIRLDFVHHERFDENQVSSQLPSGYDLASHRIVTKFTWQIKLTDGSSTYWLANTNPVFNTYAWVTTEPTSNIVYSGYMSAQPNPSLMSITPIHLTNTGDTYRARSYYNDLHFNAPLPPVTGSVEVKVNGENTYYRWNENNDNTFLLQSQPSTFIVNEDFFSHLGSVGSSISDSNSEAVNEGQTGIKYYANNTGQTAAEAFDLGDIKIGNNGSQDTQNSQNIFNVQYLNAAGNAVSALQGFSSGNTGDFVNITNLLCREFLSFQTEPLEVFQATIRSSDISPLSLLKYDINNAIPHTYKYYTFLGGTFKAQSEEMSGEWYKVNKATASIGLPSVAFRGIPPSLPNKNNIQGLKKVNESINNLNAIAVITADIPITTSINKLSFSSVSTGKVYHGQKLILHTANNVEYLIVTVNGTQAAGVSSINVDTITTTNFFPAGATLSVLVNDLSNVITAASSAPTTVRVSITAAEYASLNSTPIVLVAAPGVGKLIVPISILLYANRATTETSNNHLFVGFTSLTTSGNYFADLRNFMHNQSGSRTFHLAGVDGAVAQSSLENTALQLYSSAAFNGSISLTAYVTFREMTL